LGRFSAIVPELTFRRRSGFLPGSSFRVVSQLVRFQSCHRVVDVTIRNDGIPLEHTASFPSADFLNDTLGNSGSTKIACGRPPQIVKEQAWHFGSFAGRRPRSAKVPYWSSVLASEHKRFRCLAVDAL
jgi:hypothetical protein